MRHQRDAGSGGGRTSGHGRNGVCRRARWGARAGDEKMRGL
ncbi:hypothetical protein RSPO_c02112 [Ralstonia solanacearum Po82]|uniref:Uncharacterized protein n=1 Tax=Ralstonia solanacearum (strain Po82) TaxID=1031711 RepID=F6G255_RALS8|nr:hypothetical protein RSPO_c02112 [Ralstonia solanacearum Po82]